MHQPVQTVEIVFLILLAFVSGLAFLAKRLNTPYPIILVIGGLGLGFVPGIPKIQLNPDVIFLVVLPPLLYAAAWQTSWREFRYNLVSILLLAFGLVGFVVAGVAIAAPHILEGFDWRTGFLLGAVVSTTDAIAATSIARKLALPTRIVDILEGESLINDSTGLLALQVGISLFVGGSHPTALETVFRLIWLTVGGIGTGLLVAFVVQWAESSIDDAPIEITLGLLVPYAAYLAAESVHASGVLAVVTCGLWLSRRSTALFSPSVRLQIWPVWDALTFALNGLVFVLIGLQLPVVLEGLRDYSIRTLIVSGLLFSLLVIALRLMWVFPGALVAWLIRTRLLGQREKVPEARQVFIIGWTGMRGVIALAAALSLPVQLANGTPFPQRDLILFLTFVIILVTLVGQGLTLPPLIRRLGLSGTAGPDCEEPEARRLMLEAALERLTESQNQDHPGYAGVYEDIGHHYRHRLAVVRGDGNEQDGTTSAHHERYQSLTRELINEERRVAVQLRNTGRINDELLRRLERELDLSEANLQERR